MGGGLKARGRGWGLVRGDIRKGRRCTQIFVCPLQFSTPHLSPFAVP